MAAALPDVDIEISSVATPTKPLFPSQKLVEETEVEGLKSLLQAVKQAGTVKHFVLISTHKATSEATCVVLDKAGLVLRMSAIVSLRLRTSSFTARQLLICALHIRAT